MALWLAVVFAMLAVAGVVWMLARRRGGRRWRLALVLCAVCLCVLLAYIGLTGILLAGVR